MNLLDIKNLVCDSLIIFANIYSFCIEMFIHIILLLNITFFGICNIILYSFSFFLKTIEDLESLFLTRRRNKIGYASKNFSFVLLCFSIPLNILVDVCAFPICIIISILIMPLKFSLFVLSRFLNELHTEIAHLIYGVLNTVRIFFKWYVNVLLSRSVIESPNNLENIYEFPFKFPSLNSILIVFNSLKYMLITLNKDSLKLNRIIAKITDYQEVTLGFIRPCFHCISNIALEVFCTEIFSMVKNFSIQGICEKPRSFKSDKFFSQFFELIGLIIKSTIRLFILNIPLIFSIFLINPQFHNENFYLGPFINNPQNTLPLIQFYFLLSINIVFVIIKFITRIIYAIFEQIIRFFSLPQEKFSRMSEGYQISSDKLLNNNADASMNNLKENQDGETSFLMMMSGR